MKKPKKRGNGQGTAIKRGNSWEARVVVGWKANADGTAQLPIIKSKGGFKKKGDALAYCKVLKKTVEKPKTAPTLQFYWETYQKDLDFLSCEKQIAYMIAWKKLEPLWHRKIDTISVAELRELVAVKATTYYPAKDMKTVLKHLFNLAGADQWVNPSLPDYITLPKLEEKERPYFTKIEQNLLWDSYEMGNEDAAIPLIMIYTGMMSGEMMRLESSMIDLSRKMIAGVGLKTAVRKSAEIHLPTRIIPVIEKLLENKEGKLFSCSKSKFYSRYYHTLNIAGTRKLSPYSCRHTTATELAIDKRIDPQTIKKVMRWSTAKLLDRYAHPSHEDAFDAVELIGH